MNDVMQTRWDEVFRVVDMALDVDPNHRPDLLDRTCSGDADLRVQVERLLTAAQCAEQFLEQPVAADAAPLVSWVARQECQALAAGTRFGPYELRGLLGRGGMAAVYLAEDHKHHRTVAVKVFDSEVGAAIGREWFLREIDLAANLHHPHILPLHDSGEVDGRLYYVMPHVEGESLRQRLSREGRFTLASALRVIQEVAGALDYAHRQHVVHRDIKPENILLQDGQAIVADFGIARAIEAGVGDASRSPQTIPALGTPAYMSPEQATRTTAIDGRTDVYALGCVLYEMLAGAPPFNGPTVQAILARHAADPVPSLRATRPDIPHPLEQAITRALQKAPADRFATAGDFVQAIDSASVKLAPERRRNRALKWIVTALAVALVPTGAVLVARRSAAPLRLDPELVAILPFRLEGSNSKLTWLRQGAADLLATKLAGDGGLRAVDPRSVQSASHRTAGSSGQELTPAAERDVARSVGAGRLIDGSIVGTPEHLVMTASLTATQKSQELAHASIEGPADSLPALLDRLAARLLALGAGRDSVRMSRLPTTSLPALRAFLAGRHAFRMGRLEVAARRLQQATVLDSTFALAALELLHVSVWTRDGNARTRASRLALAGRDRLVPADRALLDLWTGPFVTGPERIDQWRSVSVTYPDRPEPWYELGDAYYHMGLSVGFADPFRLAAESFQRGWAVDSADADDGSAAERSPLVAEPLVHMVDIAQLRHDSATVLRLLAPGVAADSTSKQGWYLRWHRAVALGESAQRAFWADSQSVNPEAFGQIFEFIEFSGVAAQDYRRAANLDIPHWEASGGAAGGSFLRAMMALDGGRPRESSRYLAEINENSGVAPPGERGWTSLGKGRDAESIYLALYWGADTVPAVAAARRLASVALRGAVPANAAPDQLEARCAAATWRAARGDYVYADAAARRLRETRVRNLHGVDSVTVDGFRKLCAALLDATRATALDPSHARPALEAADAASRRFDLFLPTLGANLVVAHLAEMQGDLPLALRAVRRRAGSYGFWPAWYLSTFVREEGRLAALVADTADAVRAYRHYLALRPEPEPQVMPEVESVRRELARLSPAPRR